MDVTRKKPPFGTSAPRAPVTQPVAQRTVASPVKVGVGHVKNPSLVASRTPQPFKPPTSPAFQFKPAVAQSKNSHLQRGPVGPPVYCPQPVPKVLQKKAINPPRPQPAQAPRVAGKTLQLHPTPHANVRHAAQSKPRPFPSPKPPTARPMVQSSKLPTARPTTGIVQRAKFTRGEMKKAQGVVFASRSLKELWVSTAKLHGIDWDDLDEAQQRYFMLDVINSDAARTRRPPLKKEGKPKLVDFDYKGETKRGLDPGGSYYHEVTITYTGSRVGDFALGDADLHSKGGFRPPNTVWHHFHDYDSVSNTGRMFLMSVAEHNVGHFGGVWMYEKANDVKYGG